MTAQNKNEILALLKEPLTITEVSPQTDPELISRAIQERLNTVFGPFGWDQEFTEIFNGDKLFALKCTLSIQILDENQELYTHKKQQTMSIPSHNEGVYERLFIKTAALLGINLNRPFQKTTLSTESEPSPSSVIEQVQGPAIELTESVSTETPILIQKEQVVAEPTTSPAEPPKPVIEPISTPVLTAKEILNSRAGAHEPIKPGVYSKQETATPSEDPSTAPDLSPENSKPLTDETVAGLPEAEKKLVLELVQKLETVPPSIVKTYITGPKVKDRLSERSKTYLLSKINDKLTK